MLSKLAYAVMVSEYVPAVPYLPEIISCPPPDSGSAGGDDGNIGGGNIGGGSGGGNNSGGGNDDGPLLPRCAQVIGRFCTPDPPAPAVVCVGWPVGHPCIP